jgi:hypothetical protein
MATVTEVTIMVMDMVTTDESDGTMKLLTSIDMVVIIKVTDTATDMATIIMVTAMAVHPRCSLLA